MDPLRIGIVGAGNISGIYLTNLGKFPSTKVTALADLDTARASEIAAKHDGVQAMSVDNLLASSEVDLVLNLTIPAAHAEVARRAIDAGKHVYNEKPLSVELSDAKGLIDAAKAKNLRVGCAPDTFLGGGQQRSRRLIESGAIGTPVLAHGFMMSNGPEKWHPSPDFFYKRGAGPLMDMGPYYLTAFVNLFGPIRAVTSATRTTYPERTVGSGPLQGQKIAVETPTTILAAIEFHSGMVAQLTTTFDAGGDLPNILVFGDEGQIQVPDPNTFGGPIKLRGKGNEAEVAVDLPFFKNTRGIGVVDLAHARSENRASRASGDLALHVLEAMTGILESGATGQRYTLSTNPGQPAPISDGEFGAEAAINLE